MYCLIGACLRTGTVTKTMTKFLAMCTTQHGNRHDDDVAAATRRSSRSSTASFDPNSAHPWRERITSKPLSSNLQLCKTGNRPICLGITAKLSALLQSLSHLYRCITHHQLNYKHSTQRAVAITEISFATITTAFQALLAISNLAYLSSLASKSKIPPSVSVNSFVHQYKRQLRCHP